MANKKNAPKSAKKNTAPKSVAPAPATPTVETVETVETPAKVPATKVTINQVTEHVTSGLDANRRMDMLTNIRATFLNDPKAASKYGQNVVDVMDKVNAVGLVAAVADEIADGKSTLAAALIKQDMYPALVVAGADMGITLPAISALPAPDKDGNVQLPLKDVKISKETKETLAEEKKTQDAGDKGEIELDPKKLAQSGSDEDVKKALTYLMIKKPKTSKCGIGETLIAVRDFIHTYRKEIAKQAENSKEALEKATNASTYDELKDAFSFVEPTFLFTKIGQGLHDIITLEKCPVSAFIILRTLLTDKEGNVAWTDEDIASALHALVELYENHEIEKLNNLIEASKTEKKDYKKFETAIDDCNNVLKYMTDFDYSICEYNPEGEADSIKLKARGRVNIQYYKNEWNKEVTSNGKVKMIGLTENVSQRMGIILNLFRAPGNANAAYSESNIVKIEESEPEQATTENKEEVKNA